MNHYRIEFTGRRRHTIGITYPIKAYREAENKEQTVLALYDEYDHINLPVVTKLQPMADNCHDNLPGNLF